MKIHIISTSQLQENSYLIEENLNAILIDAGSDYLPIMKFIKENKLELKYILVTHGHKDHTISLKIIKQQTNAKIIMSKLDLNIDFGTSQEPDINLKNNQVIEFESHKIQAIHTPGHTAGSFCFYIKDQNLLFTGDTLFKHTIGRTDLTTSSDSDMKNSLKKLLELPENTIILPGHGQKTTLKEEKENNYFLK